MVTVVSLDRLRLVGSPERSRRKVWRRTSCLIEGVFSIGLCVSRSPSEESLSSRKKGNRDRSTVAIWAQGSRFSKQSLLCVSPCGVCVCHIVSSAAFSRVMAGIDGGGRAQMVVQGVGRHERGKPGSRGKCVQRRFGQKRSLLTEERSGFGIFAPRQSSGRGGDASDATPTSRRDCKGSTDRQCRRQRREFHQVPRSRVVEKERSPETQKQNSESCERGLISLCGSREWKRGREFKANLHLEKVVRLKDGG